MPMRRLRPGSRPGAGPSASALWLIASSAESSSPRSPAANVKLCAPTLKFSSISRCPSWMSRRAVLLI
ncbi:unnamed protein product [Dibothriocephalus latus]|uniref:Uncharacterized protein n=1 Tax=Dibothriocephalus latus TaxID=60516 RepID=A0A3P7N8C3_DIBLA|nr:unnamed protein product [Dibothriocephalus latus]